MDLHDDASESKHQPSFTILRYYGCPLLTNSNYRTCDKMLAARDQENLVHGHQAAAASKPLNQGTRQVPPKTPGNKIPKTPFKLPLNDENGNGGLGGGKTGLQLNRKGNENFMAGKKGGLTDNNAFVTPMGPRSRAPLGMKTTNAKTKAFQTPAPGSENDLGKTNQKSVSARKPKPRVSHAEMTKLEILGDKDELEEREIEYMPPRPKGKATAIFTTIHAHDIIDLPDYPDDIPHDLNLSMFKDGNMMRGAMGYFATRIEEDGLSHVQREEQRRQKIWDRADRREEARLQRDMDSMPIPCIHYPECASELCKDTVEARKAAEEQYQKVLVAINAETAPREKKPATKGLSIIKSKTAAATLSQPKVSASAPKATTKPSAPSAKARLNTSLVSRPKKAPTVSNPSPMRHSAATAASKTTIGYSKGRAASATLRQTVLPNKNSKIAADELPDVTLAPAEYISRYGVPRLGSDMWFRCKSAGCFKEDEGKSLEELWGVNSLDTLLREDAEQDFQLSF